MRASLEYSRKACWLLFVQWGLLLKSRIVAAACLSKVSVCGKRLDGEYIVLLMRMLVMIADLTWVPQCLMLYRCCTWWLFFARKLYEQLGVLVQCWLFLRNIWCSRDRIIRIRSQCRLLCSTFDLDDEKLACVMFRSNIWSRRFEIRNFDLKLRYARWLKLRVERWLVGLIRTRADQIFLERSPRSHDWVV